MLATGETQLGAQVVPGTSTGRRRSFVVQRNKKELAISKCIMIFIYYPSSSMDDEVDTVIFQWMIGVYSIFSLK